MGYKCDWFPLSLGYLAAALIEDGHEVKIYNSEFHREQKYLRTSQLLAGFDQYTLGLHDPKHEIWQESRRVIAEYDAELISITVRSPKFPSALNIAAIAKEHNPDIPIIMGGQHATIMPEETLMHESVDYLAREEGEETLVEFVQTLEAGVGFEKVQGLSYKTPLGNRHNPPPTSYR